MKHTAWISLLPLVTLCCLIPLTAKAQVTPDGTTATTVKQNGNNFTINQGDRIGDNLFHSFNEFSVPTNGSAAFNNVDSIANIFSRVTGSSISNIDGLLSANGTANLFLINPNGIIFGENASLNLGGSFFASTADSLLFEGDAEFSAVNPQAPPLLEVSIPIGARFRDNPGDIVNLSVAQNSAGDELVGLEVESGKNLTLLGGDINFEASEATAKGGNIYLGGLAEAGIVDFNPDGSLSFPENLLKTNISLSNNAGVDVRGTGGGNINIDAQNLSLARGNFGSSFIRGGILVNSDNGEAQAGNITLNVADNITLNDSFIANLIDSGGVGNSGNITINTGSLELINGGQVNASNLSRGDAGAINIIAVGNIIADGESPINGSPSRIISAVGADAEGNAGTVNISVNNLTIKNGGKIETIAGGQGNAGGINISTNNLSLLNGGAINNSIFGEGMGGVINITATENITFDGADLNGSSSGIFNQVSSGAIGNAGEINISTTNLSLLNGGIINNSISGEGMGGVINITATENITFDGADLNSPSGVFSLVSRGAIGDGGDINIFTNNLTFNNGGQVSTSTFGEGNAGTIKVNATGDLMFDGQTRGFFSGIFSAVQQEAQGDGGNIKISTNNLTLSNGAQVSSGIAGKGDAGAIEIIATGDLIFDGEGQNGFNSGVVSQVGLTGVGKAGGVKISTNNLTLIDGGGIDASLWGEGEAGSIEIDATGNILFTGEDSKNEASNIASQSIPSATGNAGKITISSSNLILNDGGYIETSVGNQGNSGEINITATEDIIFDGQSSTGLPSGVTSLIARDASGDAGSITVSSNNLTLTNGGRISVNTEGQGNAGDANITATNSININGFVKDGAIERFPTGITANALVENGNGGDINVSTEKLTIENGGTIEAGNFVSLGDFEPGIGQPGNINLEVGSLNLKNSGSIEAATQSQTGNTANINLTVAEDITLQNNSLISAEARENATGGNVTINANDGFILAFPNQNNDIIANAFEGKGGNINISTQAIFGLEERRSTPPNQTNDIDASSEFGLQGDFTLNTPDFDPTTGLINLPASVGDASDQISQNPCEQGVGSQFIVTGKGGLPPTVSESLNSEAAQVDLIEPLPQPLSYEERGERRGDEVTRGEGEQIDNLSTEAVPAQGWVFNDKGEVTLTAYKTTNTEIKRSPQATSNNCSAPKNK